MSEQIKSELKQILVTTLVAFVLTILLTLIFSLVAYIFKISGNPVKITIQVIKCLAIFSAIIVLVRGRKGILKGLIIGILSTLLQSAIIAIFGGSFTSGLFAEILLLGIAGAVSGIVAVNVGRKYV